MSLKRRRLGRTGFEVSEISLGTVEIGMRYGISGNGADLPPTEAEASRLLNDALDHGINLIDTARGYGESEAVIGRVLKLRRKEFFLATKVHNYYQEKAGSDELDRRVRCSVEQSLQFLQTDWIDLLMIHSAPLEVIHDGRLREVLGRLQKEGKTRHIGASVYGEVAALAAIESGAYDCLQIAYSALDRRPERAVLAAASRADVGIVVRSVLLKGALTSRCRFLPDELRPLKVAVEGLKQLGLQLPELSYRYVLGNPEVHTALVGTAHTQELQGAIEYAEEGPLPEGLRHQVSAVSLREEEQLNPANWPVT